MGLHYNKKLKTKKTKAFFADFIVSTFAEGIKATVDNTAGPLQ